MPKLTRAELARANGKQGAPAFVAYDGKVYDVSESFLWQRGKHQVIHQAGSDLTESIKEAPHGPEFLDRFPLVGMLEQD